MEDMSYWKEVWERKGRSESNHLGELGGYDNNPEVVKEIARQIVKELDIKETDKVLEVGCGAGGLAKYIKCGQYVGVDYSSSLVKKHIQILNNSVLQGEANDLIFKDKTFDKVICFGVFLYFPNKEYAKQAIAELKRVAKEAIFIGELPITSHSDEHLLFDKSEFDGWRIIDGYYRTSRFNAVCKLI
ncbi:MAG: class I SAM-dependent methyltransferase [Clostridium sp.]|uniref:class I SAM-dependent methyltransferase n=1 Tax=Clostridium sp. TaxID=1506 RepID=UPI0025C20A54|nr:class I SAM-dependent methyltransferase [Clostridium sp.]MCE5221832.1 class I SAM-dependent methyltransferase [Clostridium sp.]